VTVAQRKRIDDYAMLGDLQSVALVARTGAVEWLCIPRFDSPACFAAMLGDESNGVWRLAPVSAADHGHHEPCTRWRYRGHSLILETEWETEHGAVRVIDFMPPRDDSPDLVRIVEGLEGEVEMRSDLRIRFDYGRILPWVRRVGDTMLAVAGPDALCLRGDVTHTGRDMTSVAEFTVTAGQRLSFVMTWHPSHLAPPAGSAPEGALQQTEQFWADWTAACTYDGPWREAVLSSLVLLKGLTYAPTGSIVAAATTSLPECPGGMRNWDYRFSWLRDASFTLQALMSSGFHDEARAWRDWLLRTVAGDPADLQVMYGVAGERRLPEWEVPWLEGFGGARPVRVGNAAVNQFQLDVYGEVMDCLHLARSLGLGGHGHAWALERLFVGRVAEVWNEPDQGIWEMRGPPRHFVHSKVMAWVAVDRAIRTVEEGHGSGPVEQWRELRDRIHAEVCSKGYDDSRGSFVQSYGADCVDASLLLIPHVGFLPPDDPRVIGTINAVQRELTVDGLLLRYPTGEQAGDGLPGGEGAFLACSFWLADCLAMIGRTEEARSLFERLLDLRNDVGLLSEEYDTSSGQQVGNTPQGFSHVALVNTAMRLTGASNGDAADNAPARARPGPGFGG
jgi:GH15 family glucan-1,4-alpha-glucosidase